MGRGLALGLPSRKQFSESSRAIFCITPNEAEAPRIFLNAHQRHTTHSSTDPSSHMAIVLLFTHR